MANASLTPIIENFEKLFSKLNERFYNNELQNPVITISPDTTKGAYGWCTGWRAWAEKAPQDLEGMTQEEVKEAESKGYYEINLCAEHIARSYIEVAQTLLHEMVHLYNLKEGVQDTSRGGFYHNKHFKAAAENHGLVCEKTPKYGFSKTVFTDEAREFVESLGDAQFTLYRRGEPKSISSKKSSSSRKYVCPCCGAIIRATKEVRVICAECDVEFEEVEC